MIELGLFAIAAFWVVCAVLCYGMVMAEFGPRASYRRDAGEALLMCLFGPVSLFIVFFSTGFAERGFQWRRK